MEAVFSTRNLLVGMLVILLGIFVAAILLAVAFAAGIFILVAAFIAVILLLVLFGVVYIISRMKGFGREIKRKVKKDIRRY